MLNDFEQRFFELRHEYETARKGFIDNIKEAQHEFDAETLRISKEHLQLDLDTRNKIYDICSRLEGAARKAAIATIKKETAVIANRLDMDRHEMLLKRKQKVQENELAISTLKSDYLAERKKLNEEYAAWVKDRRQKGIPSSTDIHRAARVLFRHLMDHDMMQTILKVDEGSDSYLHVSIYGPEEEEGGAAI